MAKLYHLSFIKDLETLKPNIPNNRMTRERGENNTIPRICCGLEPDACFRGLGELAYNKIVYLYEMDVDDYYVPNINDVPDIKFTNEVWVLTEQKCKMIVEFYVDCVKGVDKVCININRYFNE